MDRTPGSHDDLLRVLGNLAEVLEHIGTSARQQAEMRLGQPYLTANELRLLSRLLRSPTITIRSMAHPSFPTSLTLRAAASLQRKGLASTQTPPPYDEDTPYAATRAASEFHDAVREYHLRCFSYALTAVPNSAQNALESVVPSLDALATALGYRDVHEGDTEETPASFLLPRATPADRD